MWGTGQPRREFLYIDDSADACVFVLKNYSRSQFVNIGFGEDMTIAEFARTVAEVVGFRGKLDYNTSKPDATPRKLVDVSRLSAMAGRLQFRCGKGSAKPPQVGAIPAIVEIDSSGDLPRQPHFHRCCTPVEEKRISMVGTPPACRDDTKAKARNQFRIATEVNQPPVA